MYDRVIGFHTSFTHWTYRQRLW